ncbi:hypothetical protein EJ04DRAFT_337043 [Polyplosphaeria fusca]|uniref:Uncharacterized protein n=1 Tax=Polyplosphaeria fusca TaxID=682080 RepID=A0A9P4V1M1_9PLEO|nr:hypothetical protein EJ04DRAFT_337043 [Polyplosphaeria fusca]
MRLGRLQRHDKSRIALQPTEVIELVPLTSTVQCPTERPLWRLLAQLGVLIRSCSGNRFDCRRVNIFGAERVCFEQRLHISQRYGIRHQDPENDRREDPSTAMQIRLPASHSPAGKGVLPRAYDGDGLRKELADRRSSQLTERPNAWSNAIVQGLHQRTKQTAASLARP